MQSDLNSISPQDHERITTAIGNAENHTSGEIYAVVAQQSDDYFFVAGFMAALWSLVLGCGLALIAPLLNIQPGLWVLAAAQLASFLASLAVFHLFPQVRLQFVPRSIAYRRASNNAVRQFLSHGIHKTSDRCGVLIFVSLAEHYAEIIADAGINQKVDQSDWDTMVGVLIDHARQGQIADGFVNAIGQAGTLLGSHFPAKKDQKNELSDRLIEI